MRIARSRRILRIGLAGSVGACLVASTSPADDMGGQVTAIVGEVVTGSGRPLEHRSVVADDERIALGKDGACSILLDEDALMELCEETAVSLEKDPQTGQRRIYVDAGAIRVIVEPRAVPERIEILTPAAIATILGTIVHVAVDPASGETTITSEENRVRVVSRDPNVPGATTVAALEQIVMRPGAPPPAEPRRLRPEDVAQLGGCVVDFHGAASDAASRGLARRAADRIATTEAEPVIIRGRNSPSGWNPAPVWSSAPEWNPAPTKNSAPASPGTDPEQPDERCTAVDCGGVDADDGSTHDAPSTRTTDGF